MEQVVTLTSHYSLLPQDSEAAFLNPDGYLVFLINGKNLARTRQSSACDKVSLLKTDCGHKRSLGPLKPASPPFSLALSFGSSNETQ